MRRRPRRRPAPRPPPPPSYPIRSTPRHRPRTPASGRRRPGTPIGRQQVVLGTLAAPGMCPATGSTGSISPRKRSGARASTNAGQRPPRLSALSVGSPPAYRSSCRHRDIAGCWCDRAGFEDAARSGPRRQPAVQNPHVGQARCLEHPPRPCRARAVPVVVGHHRGVGTDPHRRAAASTACPEGSGCLPRPGTCDR